MSPSTLTGQRKTSVETGIPISWYFDPEVLEIERRELFDQGPSYAGHVSMVPSDGDYAVRGGNQIGRVLVRHDGEVRLLSNVCRHRQAMMLTGSGRTKNIVCPVHNWAYDLEGCQVAAPHFPENPCLDLERTELAEWNGLLFAGPRDVRRELAALDGWTEMAGTDYVLDRVDDEEHDLNWKTFLDVYLEDYHIGVVHPGFRAFMNPEELRGAFQVAEGERFHCEQVNVRWPLNLAGSPNFVEFQKILFDVMQGRRPPFAAIWLCLFSGQLIEWYPYTFVVTTYSPISPTRTRLRSEYFVERDIATTRRDFVESSYAVLDEVTAEDHHAAEMFMHGRKALYERGVNAQGPFQLPMENGLRRFHRCLRSLVSNASER